MAVCGEAVLRISQDLLSKSGRLEDVRRVASHPQPLAQCRRWLDQQLPGVERVETPSTAAAARLAAEDGDVAAIASEMAGVVCGLRTIEASIEDRRDNTTRFLVLGTESPTASGCDLTSVVFTIRKDKAGALQTVECWVQSALLELEVPAAALLYLLGELIAVHRLMLY